MDVKRGRDKNGAYYQHTNGGKKYRYQPGNRKNRGEARKKAFKQAIVNKGKE